ncbi:MAG: histidinol dehydrogenase [SAR324 cluster bacterium]|uniref:Histidinol dehydrogenase n=1 Tax=marine metagenome TaxID=408172 RepID=A0A381R7N1_9ZZZZ|nr:histidinol dehydrogenase [SAR324 cluster bacterium]|tara:strand:+ start:353 stop:1630 length:1278 start_codon:yes stop_codon:yes gene_type:complete
MQVKIFEGFAVFLKAFEAEENNDVSATVQEILATVQKSGDAALREYTERFDDVIPESWMVQKSVLAEALESLDHDLFHILEEAADNIMFFHERQKTESQLDFSPDGTVLGWKVTPVDSVGIYIPGGRAVYPSTLLMNVIPAQVAEVPRIALVSPPGPSGLPHPLVMASAALMGLEELYAVGGAQSIGALAFGTESIQKVVKITGPGNAYVAEAKRQVYGTVGIDSFAGPSEIMVVCDRDDIPVEYLVRDMLSQAEHDPDAGAILVTTSTKQAKEVAKRLKELVPTLPRRNIIEASFANRSAIIVAKDLSEIFEVINELAPEHLEVLTKQPFDDLHRIRNAGAIFLGPNTPEPVGDYFAGPNHTLPTSGCAKFSSPLGVQDFVKTSSVISYSDERLQNQGEQIIRFAEEEGLFAHAAAIKVRLENQ